MSLRRTYLGCARNTLPKSTAASALALLLPDMLIAAFIILGIAVSIGSGLAIQHLRTEGAKPLPWPLADGGQDACPLTHYRPFRNMRLRISSKRGSSNDGACDHSFGRLDLAQSTWPQARYQGCLPPPRPRSDGKPVWRLDMFRDLLVHVDGGQGGRRRVQFAVALAARMGARLSGLHVTPLPDVPPLYKPSHVAEVAAGIASELALDAREAATIFNEEATQRLAAPLNKVPCGCASGR